MSNVSLETDSRRGQTGDALAQLKAKLATIKNYAEKISLSLISMPESVEKRELEYQVEQLTARMNCAVYEVCNRLNEVFRLTSLQRY